jgi:DNA adenine methylase
MPEHQVYIETHLGGGAVIRNKRAAEWNVGIDVDPAVISRYENQFDNRYSFMNRRAEDFLLKHEFKGNELIFVDPPYCISSRRSKRSPYRFDYTDDDHIELLGLLQSVPAKVMICGYDNPLYAQALKSWHKFTYFGTSHVGLRQETVWMNYAPINLHDTRYLGSSFRERQTIKRKRQRWTHRFQAEPLPIQQAILDDLIRTFGQSTTAIASHE